MPGVNSRQTLIDYCLRKLGHPVIKINVDPDQLDDRVNDAFQYFEDYHFEGVEKGFLKHQITQADIDNEYIPIPDNVLSVMRVFQITNQSAVSMFDVRYQIALQDFYNFSSHATFIQYDLVKKHLALVEFLFNQEKEIEFSRYTGRLKIFWNWKDQVAPGTFIIAETRSIIDPTQFPKVYNDRWLKKFCTELIRQQWGANMMKYGGIQLPGGVSLNGAEVYDRAERNLEKLEEEFQLKYELPVDFEIA